MTILKNIRALTGSLLNITTFFVLAKVLWNIGMTKTAIALIGIWGTYQILNITYYHKQGGTIQQQIQNIISEGKIK